MQIRHLSEASPEYVPPLHNSQKDVPDDSDITENEPAGHFSQVSSYLQLVHSVWPSKEDCPSGQSIHLLPSKNVPCWHVIHLLEFDEEYEPEGQMEQESDPLSE